MKSRFARRIPLVVFGSLLMLSGISCKKESAVSLDSAQTYPHLPEATNVLASLSQTNYAQAVSELINVKAAVTTEEQQNEFGALARAVKDTLLDAAPTDPKAAEALQAYRLLTTGR